MASDIFPGATLTQLVEWGYPMGSLRPTPTPPLAFSVIHITANTASAQNEVAWRLNDPGLQNSATFFVNPDGSIVQALGDPLHMDPWTNGDVANPDLTNPRIAALVRDGVNANERSLVTIENVGREPGNPITPEQEAACARIIAYYHAKAGLPISRETVIGHYQLNSVNRANCPSTDKSVIDRIVAKAGGTAEAPAGDDMLKGKPIDRIVNKVGVLPAPAHFRREPDDDHTPILTLPAGTNVFPDFEVEGPEGPTDRWLSAMLDYGQGTIERGYIFRSEAGPLTPYEAVGGFTQVQLDAAVKAVKDPLIIELAAAQRKIGAAKVALG